jgi:cardiolipin synthase
MGDPAHHGGGHSGAAASARSGAQLAASRAVLAGARLHILLPPDRPGRVPILAADRFGLAPERKCRAGADDEQQKRAFPDSCACTMAGQFQLLLGATPSIEDYDGTIDAMVTAMITAHVRVHLLTYIFADDRTGQRVADALGRAMPRRRCPRPDRCWARRARTKQPTMLADRASLPAWSCGSLPALRRARSDLRIRRKLSSIGGRSLVGSPNIVNDFKPGS